MDEEIRNKDGLTEAEFLQQYNPGNYEKPSVTVDDLLFSIEKNLNNLKVLLIKRNNHPFLNCWALPGGFVEMTESAFEAASRELYEETGLTGVYLEQLYTYSQPKRDPRMRVIDIAYMALLPMREAKAGDDAKDAAWFDLFLSEDEMILKNTERNLTITYRLITKKFEIGAITYENRIPQATSDVKLAFDHSLILFDGVTRLRNKAEYTDIVFNLMKEYFTLPDLQKVYESILGHILYKKNFRDKINDKVERTERKEVSITGGKKSTLYRFKK